MKNFMYGNYDQIPLAQYHNIAWMRTDQIIKKTQQKH